MSMVSCTTTSDETVWINPLHVTAIVKGLSIDTPQPTMQIRIYLVCGNTVDIIKDIDGVIARICAMIGGAQ